MWTLSIFVFALAAIALGPMVRLSTRRHYYPSVPRITRAQAKELMKQLDEEQKLLDEYERNRGRQ